jgi:hypothetical protein
VDYDLLGQLGRVHWATLGPVALSAHQTADVMLTSASFLIKIIFYFINDFRNVL